ncbi:MAG: transposase [Flavobacteriales bacterium]|nr:transposase [Flavobacteriales bacterium]
MDGLNGFSEAIQGVFTRAVYSAASSIWCAPAKFVSWKDYKTVCQGLRSIYQQDSPEAAWEKLQEFKREWVGRYPEIAAKWEKDWCELSPFLIIRCHTQGIYTTNRWRPCTAFFARPPRPRVRSSAKVPWRSNYI